MFLLNTVYAESLVHNPEINKRHEHSYRKGPRSFPWPLLTLIQMFLCQGGPYHNNKHCIACLTKYSKIIKIIGKSSCFLHSGDGEEVETLVE